MRHGVMLAHPSKIDLPIRRLQMQICNVQRRMSLNVGSQGQWTARQQGSLLLDATVQVCSWLSKWL